MTLIITNNSTRMQTREINKSGDWKSRYDLVVKKERYSSSKKPQELKFRIK